MAAGSAFIINNFKAERVLQQNAYSCTELVLLEGIPYVRKTINAVGLPYGELKNITHPCLPHIFYALEDEGKTYVIEEYISGRTLKECLEGKLIFSAEQQEQMAHQLCSVLELLHGKGILHRDIKPSNIIVMHDLQQVKLIDFGIGRSFNGEAEKETQDTCIMGTPGYAPPEQYGFSTTDQRSDIYALGKTLLELQTSDSNPKFIKVLQRCVEFDPAQRYQNAHELAKALAGQKKLSKQAALSGLAVVLLCLMGYIVLNLQNKEQRPSIKQESASNIVKPKQTEFVVSNEEKKVVEPTAKEQGKNEAAKNITPATSDVPSTKPSENGKEKVSLSSKKDISISKTELEMFGKVKLKQIGHEWWFSQKSLRTIDAKEQIFTFNGLHNRGPVVTIENIGELPAENPELILELYSFGMKAENFVHQADAGHVERVVFSSRDRLGIARRVVIRLEGTIPPNSRYTFTALQKVNNFYMYYKGDHGTILGKLQCKHMIPQSLGYVFQLK